MEKQKEQNASRKRSSNEPTIDVCFNKKCKPEQSVEFSTVKSEEVEERLLNLNDEDPTVDFHSTTLDNSYQTFDDGDEHSLNEEEPSKYDDPYKLHFGYEIPSTVTENYCELYKQEKELNWSYLGNLFHVGNSNSQFISPVPIAKKHDISDFALKENLLASCQTNNMLLKHGMSPIQLEFLSIISSYYDFLYCKRTCESGPKLRFIYCLHIINHILKIRAKIIHHNSKLSRNPDEEYRDQGFTRTTTLILVPFREDCYSIVNILTDILTNCTVMNKKRFETEYGSNRKPYQKKNPKPADFESTFAGNTNEDFKIGLKITNRSLCLYSEFYSADLIIASPLGLRTVIGAEGDKERDFDFLSSIEVLVVDRADVLLMQNWYHLIHILKHMNLLPKQSHGCNFFRVHTYALDGLAKFYRQTLLLSSVEHPWFKAVFNIGQCFNHAGYIRSWTNVDVPSICQVVLPMPQVFRWFDSLTPAEDTDDRFNFFLSQVLPQYKDPAMAQTLIYIPSYFDFVRLRNHFRSEELSTTMVCEYSKSGKVAQARDLFFKGYRHFMLYTERAHFYNRYRIKGINHILFYQLPTYPHFYSEMCNLLMHSNPRRQNDLLAENTCGIVMSKFDCIQLKYTVGMTKAKHMFNSGKKVFMITTKDS